MPRDGRRRFPAKLQSSVGGRIDLGSFCSPGNVRPADEQGLVPKRIGDLDPDFPAPGADVHDEAKGLVPENLGVPRDGRLGGRGPRSNPMLTVPRSIRRARRMRETESGQRREPKRRTAIRTGMANHLAIPFPPLPAVSSFGWHASPRRPSGFPLTRAPALLYYRISQPTDY